MIPEPKVLEQAPVKEKEPQAIKEKKPVETERKEKSFSELRQALSGAFEEVNEEYRGILQIIKEGKLAENHKETDEVCDRMDELALILREENRWHEAVIQSSPRMREKGSEQIARQDEEGIEEQRVKFEKVLRAWWKKDQKA